MKVYRFLSHILGGVRCWIMEEDAAWRTGTRHGPTWAFPGVHPGTHWFAEAVRAGFFNGLLGFSLATIDSPTKRASNVPQSAIPDVTTCGECEKPTRSENAKIDWTQGRA
ncbi:MAG TPA: hypothetical protein VNX28_18170 [Gemmataceae bacterium]|jgi:hypothetical protein|nr:hypothetical protein [Gemmataceae bacterium]